MFPPPTDAIIEGFHTDFMEEQHLYHGFIIAFFHSSLLQYKKPVTIKTGCDIQNDNSFLALNSKIYDRKNQDRKMLRYFHYCQDNIK
ncbi:MAG: hypothetical protein C0403_08085 [Desulfobacterium sp.]|nr:hypothetical protein [Desulfobacterium sp.]